MNADTPVIFTDGTDFFDDLAEKYVRHNKGLFILAPSGSGKTYFVDRQTKKHWIDGDYLWPAANADLSSDEWSYDVAQVDGINAKSDVITNEAKKLGFWIIGSSNKFIIPDAIVLPPWDTHVEYVRKRQGDNYAHISHFHPTQVHYT